nr:hypothetical protein [uncultured Arsenicibacter sp.]
METRIYITASTEHIVGELSHDFDEVFTPEPICQASRPIKGDTPFYATSLADIIKHFGSVRFSINDPDTGSEDRFL